MHLPRFDARAAAEDTSFWPPLRQKVTRPGDAAVLDAMEAEHAGTAARTVRPGHRVLVRADGPGRRRVKQARRQSGGRESEGSPISWQLLPG